MTEAPETYVCVRRQWNDWREGQIPLDKISGLHWDDVSGGIRAPSPQPFVHGYALCTDIRGEISHSGVHGPCPHRIKVCLVKKLNKEIWDKILSVVGAKPKK